MPSEKAIVAEAANRYGVRPDILWGLYGTETSFGKNVSTSSAGAVGPFQFLPSTARGLGVNPYNFRSAAFGAAKYLSQYKGRGVGGMLSAYNAGPAGGYQSGYVNTTLQNAKQFGGGGGGKNVPIGPSAAGTITVPGQPPQNVNISGVPGVRGTRATTQLNFDTAGYQKAKGEAEAAKLITNLPGGKEYRGLLGGAPKISEFLKSTTIPGQSAIPGTPGQNIRIPGTPSKTETLAGPGTSGRVPAGHELHGLLPAGARVLEWNRRDQGRDVQLTPGQVLLATGNGYVIRNGNDPSGFGPSYPIIHLTSGPEAGKDVYYGHTDSLVKPGQKLVAGQPVAKTSRTGHNAKPGWLEYGFAPGGTPGPFGQQTPF